MPSWKVTFGFRGTIGNQETGGTQAGWSESFYLPGDRTLDAASAEASALKINRLKLLSNGWSIEYIRLAMLDVSNNPTRRGTLIKLAPQGNDGNYPMPAGVEDEQPYDAINLSIASTNGSHRAFLMRGIASTVISAGGRFLNPPGWVAGFPDFAGDLAGAAVGGVQQIAWALRVRTTTAITSLSSVLIAAPAGVNIITDGSRPLIRVPVNTVQAGNNISIVGAIGDGLVNVNSQWKVRQTQVDPTNNQFTFAGLSQKRRIVVAGNYQQGGVVTYWNWTLSQITGVTAGNGASRRTGRPSGLTRGRRSVHRS